MFCRDGMLRSVTIRRAVTTESHSTSLTCSKMHPGRTDLNALLAFMPLRMLDVRDAVYVGATHLLKILS